MAKVDCEANGQLCQEHAIRAYPTIQVYMHGENSPAETYYGDRTSDAFFAWMGHEHRILAAEQAAAKAAEGNAAAPAAAGGSGGEEPAPIRMHARGSKGVEGCMMEGSLRVKRVPVRHRHARISVTYSLTQSAHPASYQCVCVLT